MLWRDGVLWLQVDIFSLAIITYELFMMCPLSIRVHKSGEPDEFPNYAAAVAAGHRETLKPTWPQELKARPPSPPSLARSPPFPAPHQPLPAAPMHARRRRLVS